MPSLKKVFVPNLKPSSSPPRLSSLIVSHFLPLLSFSTFPSTLSLLPFIACALSYTLKNTYLLANMYACDRASTDTAAAHADTVHAPIPRMKDSYKNISWSPVSGSLCYIKF